MRDYTITKINRTVFEADLYEDGNWTESYKGTEAEVLFKVRQYLDSDESRVGTYWNRQYRNIMS
jgi:hypothetical protein